MSKADAEEGKEGEKRKGIKRKNDVRGRNNRKVITRVAFCNSVPGSRNNATLS